MREVSRRRPADSRTLEPKKEFWRGEESYLAVRILGRPRGTRTGFSRAYKETRPEVHACSKKGRLGEKGRRKKTESREKRSSPPRTPPIIRAQIPQGIKNRKGNPSIRKSRSERAICFFS